MRGIGKNKEKEKMPTRGSHRRSKVSGSVEEVEEVVAPEGVEEVGTSEEPEITISECDIKIQKSQTLAYNLIVRLGESVTPLEWNAIIDISGCADLVLEDDEMMELYQTKLVKTEKKAKEEEAKEKRG